VNDDRQDARPGLLAPRRNLGDAHADTVTAVEVRYRRMEGREG
jgi:hypothetical protein